MCIGLFLYSFISKIHHEFGASCARVQTQTGQDVVVPLKDYTVYPVGQICDYVGEGKHGPASRKISAEYKGTHREQDLMKKQCWQRFHRRGDTWAPSSPTLHRDKHSESISCRESSVTSKSPSVSPGPPVRSNTRNDHCWRASSRLSGSSGHLGRQVTLQKLVDVRSFEEGWGTLPGTSSGQKGRGRKRNRHLKQRQLWRRMTKLWVWVPPRYWRELEKSVFLTFGYLFWKMKIRISNLSSSQWWFLDEMYKMFCKPDRLPQWNNALLLSFLLLYQYHY